MANHPQYNYPDIGIAGEDLVVEWLQSEGWAVLYRRWRYRRGEIDIIAQYSRSSTPSPRIAFVEVKTRSPGNWDKGGRYAVTQKKQGKLWRTALMFLAKYPEKANYSCQFDVAIVGYQQIAEELYLVKNTQKVLASSLADGYQFTLHEYIPAAFDCPTNW